MREVALDFLTGNTGYFLFGDLLENSGYALVPVNSIRWDYFKKLVEESFPGSLTEIIGVVDRIADKEYRYKYPLNEYPERYLSGGNGRPTAGYALVCRGTKELSLKKHEVKVNKALGFGRAADFTRDVGMARGIEGFEDRKRMLPEEKKPVALPKGSRANPSRKALPKPEQMKLAVWPIVKKKGEPLGDNDE